MLQEGDRSRSQPLRSCGSTRRDPSCPPDPFENENKYPGVKIGARGKNIPVGSYYGYATGIVGLRLFPNPDFDEAAAKKWDPKRYYTDPNYYNDKNLVRPYRVGMSCALLPRGSQPGQAACRSRKSQVGEPELQRGRAIFLDRPHLRLGIGSQQAFRSSSSIPRGPGTLDTSLVSTDNINNPRTMNAVYGLLPRLDVAKRWGKETLAGGELNNKQFNEYVHQGPLTRSFSRRTRCTRRAS